MHTEKEYESLDDYVKLSQFADLGLGIAFKSYRRSYAPGLG